ncbi:hypothetical protein N7492_003053 [Penicillium capsulatum]|uniref:Wax synthase domain-containing protein n=1 Tax=Penicillium capsulatum TaxID=69766 RepID=A0A9W9LVT7_9EURO|nr:hypothetical protein N7492_003053 [Penicillium capsulatum]KAJ6122356.1 hypothetical protein N7512_004821 [Penicillium capsulatum]
MLETNENPYLTLSLGALSCLVLATLLVATPKGSVLRYAPFPFMIWITTRFARVDMHPNYAMRCVVSNFVVLNLQAARLLLIHPLDNDDIGRALALPQTFLIRVYHALKILLCTRAIGTPWQVKNVPSYPAYYNRRGMEMPLRPRFLARQLLILTWQYLFLDLVNTAMLFNPPQNTPLLTEPGLLGINWTKAAEKGISNSLGWMIVARVQIDFHDRLATTLLVLLGVDAPSAFRPSYGRLGDAYTLRNFWGKYWHQYFREPFSTFGCFLARNVLRLPRPSRLERYTNLFFVFFASGVMHLVIDHYAGVQESGAMPFFCAFAPGIMIEDAIQELWRRTRGYPESEISSPWRKAVGFLWVILWLGATSSWYVDPLLQTAKPPPVVPFGLRSQIPLPVLGSVLLAGGVGLKLVFEVEV